MKVPTAPTNHGELLTPAEHVSLRNELAQRMESLLKRRPVGEPVHSINAEENKNEADQVARLMEQNAAISLCNQTMHQLREICAALARMSTGAYGRCSECREAIAKARLMANPSAALCFSCQSRSDLGQWLSFSSPKESMQLPRVA